jgi:hypothetical protein
MTCVAKLGLSFTDFSLLTGQQYRNVQRPLWAIEFQFDRFSSNCLRQRKYFGIGAIYSFNTDNKEIGLKAMWNPTNLTFLASRSTKFYPYLFGQFNLQNPLTTETYPFNNFGLRPGLGLTGRFQVDKILSIRSYLQLGYNTLVDNKQNFKNALTFEFKIGIGFNAGQGKSNQQKDKDLAEQ